MTPEKALEIVKAIRRPAQAASPVAKHTALRGTRPNPTGVVYFAYSSGRVKIGFTTSIGERMASLATSCPFPVLLLLTITGDLEDEMAMHQRFAEDRVNLEWFRVSADLLAFLDDSLCEDGTVVLTNAQFEARMAVAECLADIVNETGGDDGRLVEAVSWPKALQFAET